MDEFIKYRIVERLFNNDGVEKKDVILKEGLTFDEVVARMEVLYKSRRVYNNSLMVTYQNKARSSDTYICSFCVEDDFDNFWLYFMESNLVSFDSTRASVDYKENIEALLAKK